MGRTRKWKQSITSKQRAQIALHVISFIESTEITKSDDINECEYGDLLEFIEGMCEITGYYWGE